MIQYDGINKTNKILIIVIVALIIINAIAGFFLVNSYNDNNLDLPDLEVTQGKTSTKRSTVKTTPTTTTTTTKVVNLNSPYYNIDVNSILNTDLLTKQNLTREEASELIKLFVETSNKIFDTSNNELLDIQTTIQYAKDGEKDRVEINGEKYGIIYNSTELFEKLYTNQFIKKLKFYKNNNSLVFYTDNVDYYRIENKFGSQKIDIVSYELKDVFASEITGGYTFYKSTYKEDGYSSPVYQKATIKLLYQSGGWKINDYKYPLFD